MPAEVSTERIELPVSDGTKMGAFLAKPRGAGRHPGLIVYQEAFGVNAHIRNVAERFAQQGYVALAPELYHRVAPGFEGRYDDFGPIKDLMAKLTPEGLEADVKAAYAALAARPEALPEKTACVGFCMGGRMAFLTASLVPVKAAVSFYGAGMALERAKDVTAPLLMFWGLLDKHIPEEVIASVDSALTKAGKAFTDVRFAKADHGFFCDARPSYNPDAARQAFALTLEFLKTHAS